MRRRSGFFLFFLAVGLLVPRVYGCTSKLVRIDSNPGLAEIHINSESVGKTPLYHRFRDHWFPWPFEKSDDYTITARYGPEFLPEEQFFGETSPWPEIDYIPDELLLELEPVDSAESSGS